MRARGRSISPPGTGRNPNRRFHGDRVRVRVTANSILLHYKYANPRNINVSGINSILFIYLLFQVFAGFKYCNCRSRNQHFFAGCGICAGSLRAEFC